MWVYILSNDTDNIRRILIWKGKTLLLCAWSGTQSLKFHQSTKKSTQTENRFTIYTLTWTFETWNVTHKMALALPLLVEANLIHCIFTADDIVQFINKCPLLRILIVGIKRSKYNELQKYTNNKWHTTFDEELNQVSMERMDWYKNNQSIYLSFYFHTPLQIFYN